MALFVRFRAFQWATANPNNKLPPRPSSHATGVGATLIQRSGNIARVSDLCNKNDRRSVFQIEVLFRGPGRDSRSAALSGHRHRARVRTVRRGCCSRTGPIEGAPVGGRRGPRLVFRLAAREIHSSFNCSLSMKSFVTDSPFHPEDIARAVIDRRLAACGWAVQSRSEMNVGAAQGVAVREFHTTSGPVDYAIFVDRRLSAASRRRRPGYAGAARFRGCARG